MGINNLHIYPSTFRFETRILKETKSVAEALGFNKIYIAALWEHGLPECEDIDNIRQVWRINPSIGSQQSTLLIKMIRYIGWQYKIFQIFRHKSIKIVNCHSLPVLPLGILFKLFCGTKLIYDAHELETETTITKGIRKILAKTLERFLIRYVDNVIVVSKSIENWYRNKYKLSNIITVRNVPYYFDFMQSPGKYDIKKNLDIKSDEIIFIYHGALSHGRGITTLLDVFSTVEKSKHLVLMGYGEYEKTIKEYTRIYPNIHFLAPVSPDEVTACISSADVGIYPMENTSLNHYFALPNKIFEFLMAGLPVIASDFPEIGKVIDEGDCGWKLPLDLKETGKLVNSITKGEILAKKSNVIKYRKKLDWHIEARVMIEMYKNMLRFSSSNK